jgi:hypothetical protein
MTGIRKVLTKAEAITEASYITAILHESRDHPAWPAIETAWHMLVRSGKWLEISYGVKTDLFKIVSMRRRHDDGRVRGAYNDLENPLGFALFCIEHFLERPRSQSWRERIEDERLVRATLGKIARPHFVMPKSVTMREIAAAVDNAILLGKVSA